MVCEVSARTCMCEFMYVCMCAYVAFVRLCHYEKTQTVIELIFAQCGPASFRSESNYFGLTRIKMSLLDICARVYVRTNRYIFAEINTETNYASAINALNNGNSQETH